VRIVIIDEKQPFEEAYQSFFFDVKQMLLLHVSKRFGVKNPSTFLSQNIKVSQGHLSEFLNGKKKLGAEKIVELCVVIGVSGTIMDFIIKLNTVIELNRTGDKKYIYHLVGSYCHDKLKSTFSYKEDKFFVPTTNSVIDGEDNF
jgi:plasmid maintenance system antidote protein VapI